MMMEEREEANRVMIHEWEIADAAATAAEDKLRDHNEQIQYEINIIAELNLPEGEEQDKRWKEISAMRDQRGEMKQDAADKRAKATALMTYMDEMMAQQTAADEAEWKRQEEMAKQRKARDEAAMIKNEREARVKDLTEKIKKWGEELS